VNNGASHIIIVNELSVRRRPTESPYEEGFLSGSLIQDRESGRQSS